MAEAESFQVFQRQLAHYLRDPHHRARPAGLSARGAHTYRELVFNNLTGFLDACFPVSRRLLGEARWRRLNRCFLRDWPLQTPWFREIPQAFVRYLNEGACVPVLPGYLPELAHYEWVELWLDTLDSPTPPHDPQGDLLQPLVFNPAHQLLNYQWPVHRIGPDYRPRRPEPVALMVYRDALGAVHFMQLNNLTARLLALLIEDKCSGAQALQQIATELKHLQPEQIQAFGLALLKDLHQRGLILGSMGDATD